MSPECFVVFACMGRSGHTILAAILDAHPNIMISEERHIHVRAIKERFSSLDELYLEVMRDSKHRAERDHTYRMQIGKVDGQYQGTYEDKVKVLGDKTGWSAVEVYREIKYGKPTGKSKIFLEFQKLLGIPLKVIHALRNPFDVIGSNRVGTKTEIVLGEYARLTRNIQKTCYESDFPRDQILRVRNEDLCANPRPVIEEMINFLELEASQDYLNTCVKAVRPLHCYKDKLDWPAPVCEKVNNIISSYDFLESYSL